MSKNDPQNQLSGLFLLTVPGEDMRHGFLRVSGIKVPGMGYISRSLILSD